MQYRERIGVCIVWSYPFFLALGSKVRLYISLGNALYLKTTVELQQSKNLCQM